MLGLCLVAAFATSAVSAGSALAFEQNLEQYKFCPFKNPLITDCTYGHTTAGEGGQYTVGPITIPITNSIALQGGFYEDNEGVLHFILPANGQAVVPVAETVPGEPLANVTPAEQKEFGWTPELEKSYENARIKGLLGPGTVTEVIETAGIPELSLIKIVFEEGTGITAPVKITGQNKWLEKLGHGKVGDCKIGSNRSPIVQHLTTGTTTSPLTGETLRGSTGELEIEAGGALASLKGVDLVDNTYAVPAAEGCGGPQFEQAIDPVLDRAFGLPAPAGASVTELRGEFDTAGSTFLKEQGIR